MLCLVARVVPSCEAQGVCCVQTKSVLQRTSNRPIFCTTTVATQQLEGIRETQAILLLFLLILLLLQCKLLLLHLHLIQLLLLSLLFPLLHLHLLRLLQLLLLG